MSLSNNQLKLKRTFNKDLSKISLFTPVIITLLIVFLSLIVVAVPVSAVENKNSQVTKQEVSFFDKVVTFVKSPFVSPVLAQGNQNKTTAPKKTQQNQSFLGSLWNFITAPYRVLFAPTNSTPKAKVTVTPRPVAQNQVTPTPEATPSFVASNNNVSTNVPAVVASPSTTVATSVSSLNAGTTFVDLIGKTIVDSNGNVYPSGSALAQTDKPTLGTTTNKFYGLNLYQFSIDKVGGITTVLPGGIVKASSKGVLSSSAVSLDSGDVSDTLQVGKGGTGITAYAVGDIIYSGTVNNLTKLAIGSSNQILTVASGIPSWSSTLSLTSGAFSSALSLSDGTAATPALNFTSDTDSGLWRIGANQVALTTGGAAMNGLSVNSSGNVGIGVSSAVQLLQVGSSLTSPSMVVTSGGNVGIGTSGSSASLTINGNALVGYAAGAPSSLSNGLAVSGNVGIGTTGPGSALTVIGNVGIGTSAAGSNLDVSGNGVIGWGTASVAGPANGLGINGNVGVGTTSPTSNLHVVGTANVTGNSTTGGTSTLTGAVTIAANSAALTFSGTTPSITSGSSLFGLFAGGNVGIGTTATMGSAFNVNGGTVVGNSFIGGAAPANGLATQGNVGIGTSTTSSELTVQGGYTQLGTAANTLAGVTTLSSANGALVFSGSTPSLSAGTNLFGLFAAGNVGIGTTATMGSAFNVNGGQVVGSTFIGGAAPANGLGVQGNVGIGTSTANSALTVSGGATIGNGVAYQVAAPSNGLLVQGNVGIGTTTPEALFQIGIGNNYGFRVSSTGNVGIGTSVNNVPISVGTDGTTGNGAYLSAGGVWTNASSREFKTNFVTLDLNEVLGKVNQMPILQWNYKNEDPSVKHIGPIAEDFYAAFGLGDDNKHISTLDPSGVALASIQALTNRVAGLELREASASATANTTDATVDTTVSAVGLSLDTFAQLGAEGGLVLTKAVEVQAPSIFNKLADFLANVIFRGDVNFLGRIFLSRDSAGTAVVTSGADAVTVSFARGYDAAPIVNVTPTMQAGNDGAGNSLLTGDVRFVVQAVSGSGFTIKLNKPAPANLVFSWTAVATANANQVSSSQSAASSTPAPELTVEATPTPTAEPSPSVSPSAEPSTSPTPAPELTVEATPTPTAEPSPSVSPSAEPSTSPTPAPSATTEPTPSPSTSPVSTP